MKEALKFTEALLVVGLVMSSLVVSTVAGLIEMFLPEKKEKPSS